MGLFDHDFGKPAAEVFAFIGYGQRDIEGGLAVDGGNFGLLLLHLLGLAIIHCLADGQRQGQLSEQGNVQGVCQLFAAVAAENGFVVAALAANVDRHVFQHAEDGNVDLLEHVHGFAGVNQGDVLRGGHDYRAGHRNFLGQGELDVAGAGRQVDKQVVHIVPFALKQELLQGLADHRAAPDDGLAGVDQKAYRHDLDAVCRAYGDEFAVGLIGLAVGHAEHGRLAWAVQIRIQYADPCAHFGHGDGQIGGSGGFADAAFAGSDGYDVFDAFDGSDAGLDLVGGNRVADVQMQRQGATCAAERLPDALSQFVVQVGAGETECQRQLEGLVGFLQAVDGFFIGQRAGAARQGDLADQGLIGMATHDNLSVWCVSRGCGQCALF